MNSEEIINLEENYHLQVYKRHKIVLSHGKGCMVYDINGKEYIDCLSGIAVNSLGHAHPALLSAINEQAPKLMHISNLFYNEPQSRLAELLAKESRLNRVFFCNSGAEATEAAIKLTRRYAYKNETKGDILSLENCFHGRTITSITMGKEKYQEGFGPLPEGFAKVENGNLNALREKFHKGVIGIVIEPVLGEGGIHIVDKEFMMEARRLCDENNALLISDEIQCGIGRTGKLFAYDNYGIMPDIVTLAKALGSGFPIGAIIVKQKVADAIDFGLHGTTFGGNPLACAVGFAAVSTIINDELPAHSEKMGKYFIDRINNQVSGLSIVSEVRGMGLMIGVELKQDCSQIVSEMVKRGALASCTAGNTIRILPPLIIKENEIDRFVSIMIDVLKEHSN